MKIIFSRKGFDSSAGGVPSPILPDGTIVSLPIPDHDSPITYDDVRTSRGGFDSLGKVVEDLTRGRLTGDHGAHLDPDLDASAIARLPGWRPMLGQVDAAQTHLRRHEVGPGDLFVFFGWFRQTELHHGKLRFSPGAPDIHLIWGWLRIGEARAVGPPANHDDHAEWARYHPHFHGRRGANNTLYVAAPQTSGGLLDSAGVLATYSEACRLTAPGKTRSIWRLPQWFDPGRSEVPLSYHHDRSRWAYDSDGTLLRTVARGQEFVLDSMVFPESVDWIATMLGD